MTTRAGNRVPDVGKRMPGQNPTTHPPRAGRSRVARPRPYIPATTNLAPIKDEPLAALFERVFPEINQPRARR